MASKRRADGMNSIVARQLLLLTLNRASTDKERANALHTNEASPDCPTILLQRSLVVWPIVRRNDAKVRRRRWAEMVSFLTTVGIR